MNSSVDVERIALASALSHASLTKLQTWFSPSFPIGGFSYSHGLEWLVETREVRDARSLTDWVAGTLRYGAGRNDAIFVASISRSICNDDWEEVARISELAAAMQPTLERRLESLNQGAAFLTAVAAGWPHPLIDRFRQHCHGDLALPVAVGASTAAHGLPLDAVLVASVHAFAAMLVSAGVRLIPLGQTEGLRIMATLEPVCVDIAREAHTADLDDLGSSTFLSDIASMRHETQHTRLFRS